LNLRAAKDNQQEREVDTTHTSVFVPKTDWAWRHSKKNGHAGLGGAPA
jgi:hypothetical protein